MRFESKAVQEIAVQLAKQGYEVVVEPDTGLIPFDLEGYKPDILAKKKGENVLVEVKSRHSPRTVERYQRVAQIVGSQPGWRFLISTIPEESPIEDLAVPEKLDPRQIRRRLEQVRALIDSDMYELAPVHLWTIYIAAVREVGHLKSIPLSANSDRSILNYMYSLGELSHAEYEQSLNYMQIRNELAHSMDTRISKNQVVEMFNFVIRKLADWRIEPGH